MIKVEGLRTVYGQKVDLLHGLPKFWFMLCFELSGLQQGFSRFRGFGCCLRVFGLGSFRALSRAQGFGICLGLRVEKLVIQGFRL